jgi:hypothetical protein
VNDVNCPIEWIEELCDMDKDIAVLKVKDCNNVKSLKYTKEAMAQLPVLRGYSDEELDVLPQGSPVEKGSLSCVDFPVHWNEHPLHRQKIEIMECYLLGWSLSW